MTSHRVRKRFLPNSAFILNFLGVHSHQIQATTVIVETVIVESTVLVEQKPLTTTQFYLLQTTILVETTVIVEQKPLTVFSTITVVACITCYNVFSIKQQRIGCGSDLTLFLKLVWREDGMWWCVGSLRLTPNYGRALVRDLSLTSEAPLHPDPLAQCRPSNHSSLHTHCPEASATLFCWLPA